jgi:hypothetical protein
MMRGPKWHIHKWLEGLKWPHYWDKTVFVKPSPNWNWLKCQPPPLNCDLIRHLASSGIFLPAFSKIRTYYILMSGQFVEEGFGVAKQKIDKEAIKYHKINVPVGQIDATKIGGKNN